MTGASMTEESRRFLRVLVEDIHTTVMATVGSDGYPHTCAVDMMLSDDEGAYFLTARGKGLYDRLKATGRVSLTGVRGGTTMTSVAVSLVGDVTEVPERLGDLLDANRYMYDIYPTEESRRGLTAFCIHRGSGEFFDLSTRPIRRVGFSYGGLVTDDAAYGLWQCSRPCCQRTYDNESVVRRMCQEQRDMRVPSELVPRCPRCGSPMTMNLRTDDTFVQDRGWHEAAGRYRRFAESAMRGRTLYLELGVGYNTPGIIKYPFWRMAADNRRSRYVSISLGTCQVPNELVGRSLGIDMDIRTALEAVSHGPERRSANDETMGVDRGHRASWVVSATSFL